ncbi:mechanosensitive ion channel family protein [Marinoscillum furvescens]|uniref:Small conductance mechanosensitive channel n=1 Tax=Marinoscillum furvescens DSM 4134 TaxID=1122208 RepID=A0A3D9KXJ9_MARFU|nr:mechanosensitive ion channel domain-containing protein [Marinoscillum furvescens]RED91743.1 small conductance mechanosensitive channel [Marinoscillum furvescens DSM 4134]
MNKAKDLSAQAMEYVWTYGPKVVLAIITLIVGLWIIGIITKNLRKVMTKREMDPSLVPFLTTILSVALKIMLLISVVGMVGIEVTSFIAVLGAAGLAVGLALQGTLQNFAGGVVLLILRPFKVGDVVDVKGYLGTIKEIHVFYTIVSTFDKKTVYIPNGDLANSDMTNLSQEEIRRNAWTFGIGYGDDVDQAKTVLKRLIDEDERILDDPEPFIAVESLGDSSVNLVIRAWSTAADLWPVHFDMNEKVYKEFAKEGLNIPFPQMDVHLHKEKED